MWSSVGWGQAPGPAKAQLILAWESERRWSSGDWGRAQGPAEVPVILAWESEREWGSGGWGQAPGPAAVQLISAWESEDRSRPGERTICEGRLELNCPYSVRYNAKGGTSLAPKSRLRTGFGVLTGLVQAREKRSHLGDIGHRLVEQFLHSARREKRRIVTFPGLGD